jgi:NAD(P)-dependent dehydrogenase (short-subunit alcohol dehydrogenase family)
MSRTENFQRITPRYPELKGKVALVTGSSRGIGRGIAARLALEGMRLVIHGLDSERAAAAAGEMRDLGAEAVWASADVGTSEGVAQLFAETLDAFGRVDLLVNNAADLRRVTFFEVDEALLDHQLAVNIRGPYLLAYKAAESMKAAGGGSIIHISSVGGKQAHWRGLPYDLTKGALDAMTRAMAVELADEGIRVNAVAPGATQTERITDPEHPRIKAVCRRIPLGRMGLVEEIGAVVAFLASPDAAYITGQVLYVDGGLTAQLSPRDQPV